MFKKYAKIVLFPGIVCLILLYVFLQQDSSAKEEVPLSITTISQEQNEKLNSETVPEPIEEPVVEKIMVDVKGAVQLPGVYVLTTEDRVIDAIEKAGGYLAEAQSTVLNHAQKLQDEMVIYIPKKGEEVDQSSTNGQVVSSSATSSDSGGKVDLNSADEAALTTIPGIGPSKAQAILAYREENGSFKTIEELKNISGIGDKTFEKLKEFIVVK